MKVNHFSPSGVAMVLTMLTLMTTLVISSPVAVSSLTTNADTSSNPFLDLSSCKHDTSSLNLEDPSTWAIDIQASTEDTSTAAVSHLEKRHDYAMVCANAVAHTTYCQRSPREYYCSQNGFLVQKTTATVRYAPCEEQCVCVNVDPKPRCLVGYSGTSFCVRSLPDGGSIEYTSTAAISNLEKRHDYAMVCGNAIPHTNWRQRSPREYYSTSTGKLAQQTTATERYVPCEENCACVNLNPKPRCFVGWSGTSFCVRSLPNGGGIEYLKTIPFEDIDPSDFNEAEEAEVIHISELTDHAAELEATIEPNVLEAFHDLARREEEQIGSVEAHPQPPFPDRTGGDSTGWYMLCVDREDTELCWQSYGYYCTRAGKLAQAPALPLDPPRTKLPYCERHCVCENLYPKPVCFINVIGLSTCLRSLPDGDEFNHDMERAIAGDKEHGE
ncbi:hypothetical protein OHC33_003259 [Knufia fluminis]|uniref:Uncharacterized protein n=1 Tax=Knufia fluminis TaxID=191047 RepID=A0AAN8F376_9EURO|nr:hypothetical protein OHC33_003259 [Knufia fluminis]